MQGYDGKWTAGYLASTLKIVAFGNIEESLLNYNWPLVIMNIKLQHRRINFWIATNTLYLKMLPKKASKIPQKYNFYFKLLLKCFKIGSKCNSTPKTLLKRLQKCGSTFNMLQIKGKQKQLNASTHLLQNRAQFLDWHSKSLNN